MKELQHGQPLKSRVSDLIRDVLPGEESIIDVMEGLSEDGVPKRRIEFAQRVQEPEVARAKARNHEFHSLKAFCEYLDRECEAESALVLANVAKAEMVATIAESRQSDHEWIRYQAKTHPLFRPWLELIGKSIPVTEFALFVMRYRNAVVEPDGRELALTFSQIKASKSITKKVGLGPKSLNGVMIELQIGSERNEVPVELPESITIQAPLYLDTDPVDIKLDLLVTEGSEGRIVVFVTAPELEELCISVFQRMVSQVQSETSLIVGLGEVRSRPWELVKAN